jgi:hypothetical protein
MCDGSFNLKMLFIRELIAMEKPEESHDYLQEHLTWTVEELKAYRDKFDKPGYRTKSTPVVN